MFTDGPVTPLRVEATLEALLRSSEASIERDRLLDILQPINLPGVNPSREQAKLAIKAARELNLIEEEGEELRLSAEATEQKQSTAREKLLAALDAHVLRSTSVEPYFAPIYSFLLGRDSLGQSLASNDDVVDRYHSIACGGQRAETNPLNTTKFQGIKRWLTYAGLGWMDPSGNFQPNPYGRVRRVLSSVFDSERISLKGEEFIEAISQNCPELDGGMFFKLSNPDWNESENSLSTGLSNALVELHEDRTISLDCPTDSRGWSIARATPPTDDRGLKSDRIGAVKFLGGHDA